MKSLEYLETTYKRNVKGNSKKKECIHKRKITRKTKRVDIFERRERSTFKSIIRPCLTPRVPFSPHRVTNPWRAGRWLETCLGSNPFFFQVRRDALDIKQDGDDERAR